MTNTYKRFFQVCAALLAVAIFCLFAADFLDRFLRERREEAIYQTVIRESQAFGVSPALVFAVIRVESDFQENAFSNAGAIGLMQLMPNTFYYLRDEKRKEALPDDALWLPDVNIQYGTYYLAYLQEKFEDITTILAAYNAGEGRVVSWLTNPSYSDNGKLIDIPFLQTKEYVRRVLMFRDDYQKKYNFKE